MRCDACPSAPGRPCHGPAIPHLCAWAASGDPFLVRSVVDRNGLPPPGDRAVAPASGPPARVELPPLAFPDCPLRGALVESGAGCGCGPKHLCVRDTRVVGARDCGACLAATAPPAGGRSGLAAR